MSHKQLQLTLSLADAIDRKLREANGRRRRRCIDYGDVLQALDEASSDGYGWVAGSTVAKAYRYPAWRSAVVAVCFGDAVAFDTATINASSGSSPVTWAGPANKSASAMVNWYHKLQAAFVECSFQCLGKDWFWTTRAEVLDLLRDRDRIFMQHAQTLINDLPDVVITADDSLRAGNCPLVTERVAQSFHYTPTRARTVAMRFPKLTAYVRRAAVAAQARITREQQ